MKELGDWNKWKAGKQIKKWNNIYTNETSTNLTSNNIAENGAMIFAIVLKQCPEPPYKEQSLKRDPINNHPTVYFILLAIRLGILFTVMPI